MVPCVGVEIGGKKYYPLYNNNAMFRINESYDGDVFDKITENSKAGFQLAFELFAIMCEEGEAVRKHYGYTKGNIPNWEDAQMEYMPPDVILMKNAVFAAVTAGCGRDVPDTDDIDLTLLEVQKKTKRN